MNENQIFLSYIPEEDDSPLDLKDILAQILLRWKLILVFMIIFGALGIGFAYYRANKQAQNTSRVADRISNTRKGMSEETAEYVENLHSRYLSLQEYQRFLQERFSDYLANASNPDKYILLNTSYCVSTSIDHLDEILSSVLFSEDDYEAMREVVDEESSLAPIYNRVSFVSANSTDNNNAVMVSSEENHSRSDYLFLVTIYGDSQEQCEKLIAIVENALQNTINSYNSLDPNIKLSPMERKYNKNTRDFIQKQINSSMNLITGVDNQLNNLRNNQITKLPDDQLAYYNLLLEGDAAGDSAEVAKPRPQRKKWLAVGSILGAFLAIGLLLMIYFLDGKIKIAKEAEFYFHKPVIQKVFKPGKMNLFGIFADLLINRDHTALDVKTEMIAADLLLQFQKNDTKRVFLLCDKSDTQALDIANLVIPKLTEKASDLSVDLGDPTASVSELEEFSSAKNAVAFVELKHSRKSTLSSWQELCTRYSIPVIGIVSAEKCW